MNVYAESSAILAWLVGEAHAPLVREALGVAELIVASDLTLIECDRVLIRAATTGQLSEAQVSDRQSSLRRAAAHWVILGLGEEVVERARRPFPIEPIRTLDAIHLATALTARNVIPELGLLSLDQRLRTCATRLGFDVLPADSGQSG